MKKTILLSLAIGLLCANVYAINDSTQLNNKFTNNKQVSMQTIPEKNKTAGETFLAANKNKEGIVTLPDGLQYKIITAGKGAKPSLKDTVKVHYAGKLIDGKEFDSSYKRGQPASFPVGAVIPGWVEALQLMPVGSIWELYIPSQLAYGTYGAPPLIGPNSVLIFKVELLDIVNKAN